MSSAEHRGHLSLDRLDDGAAVQVRRLEAMQLDDDPVREPHRHDYHELIWVASGDGEHLIDGSPVPVQPGTVMLIGRGQVHVLKRAEGLVGAVLRIGDELLADESRRAASGWLLAGRGGRSIPVPPSERERLDATIDAIAAESVRPPDPYSGRLERHLIATVLLWVERWYDASRIEGRDADDADIELQRRFAELLEGEYAQHHEAAYYADALAVPAAALSRALTQVTGRGTKDLVLDRVMLEAARLLRFTEKSVGEVAFEVGYDDPFYFSRAFKRRFGDAPQAYRDRVRGR
jgi:AraC family transcriptional activator of pobA